MAIHPQYQGAAGWVPDNGIRARFPLAPNSPVATRSDRLVMEMRALNAQMRSQMELILATLNGLKDQISLVFGAPPPAIITTSSPSPPPSAILTTTPASPPPSAIITTSPASPPPSAFNSDGLPRSGKKKPLKHKDPLQAVLHPLPNASTDRGTSKILPRQLHHHQPTDLFQRHPRCLRLRICRHAPLLRILGGDHRSLDPDELLCRLSNQLSGKVPTNLIDSTRDCDPRHLRPPDPPSPRPLWRPQREPLPSPICSLHLQSTTNAFSDLHHHRSLVGSAINLRSKLQAQPPPTMVKSSYNLPISIYASPRPPIDIPSNPNASMPSSIFRHIQSYSAPELSKLKKADTKIALVGHRSLVSFVITRCYKHTSPPWAPNFTCNFAIAHQLFDGISQRTPIDSLHLHLQQQLRRQSLLLVRPCAQSPHHHRPCLQRGTRLPPPPAHHKTKVSTTLAMGVLLKIDALLGSLEGPLLEEIALGVLKLNEFDEMRSVGLGLKLMMVKCIEKLLEVVSWHWSTGAGSEAQWEVLEEMPMKDTRVIGIGLVSWMHA